MPEEKNAKDKNQKQKKRNFLDTFLTREEPDDDYLPDLKTQWNAMNNAERVKFVLGAIIGLMIVLGGIVLIFLLISALRS